MPTAEHAEVLLAVDREWRTSRQIHKLLGMWSLVTVRNALNAFAGEGKIECRTETVTASLSRKVYRAKEKDS